MDYLQTPQGLLTVAAVVLLGRYMIRFLDKLADKWFDNSNKSHSDFVTFQHCKLHRDSCIASRSQEEKAWKRDFKTLKLVIYRIGRKLEIEDKVLEQLIGEEEIK